jgi:lipopolysaccharide/colanic/teichoic acid biosynthesis glycosyltransferase
LADSVLELGLSVAVLPSVKIAPSAHEVRRSDAFAGLPMTLVETIVQPPAYLFAKRLLDIVLSSIGLVLISPLLLVVALLIKITSPDGPVFYPWRVMGKNRRHFVGYKFRTMVANADELKKQLDHQNEMTGPVFKIRNDPRITPLGRWLRRYSIDELPQLYSVLKGDMTLVGPRPGGQWETGHYEPWQHRKLSVKPGITCLWQVSGRTEISDFKTWVKLDLEYIRTASLAVDLKILLRTIPVVLFGRGAY